MHGLWARGRHESITMKPTVSLCFDYRSNDQGSLTILTKDFRVGPCLGVGRHLLNCIFRCGCDKAEP